MAARFVVAAAVRQPCAVRGRVSRLRTDAQLVALGHGDWRESLRLHRVGWLLAAAVVLQIPFRMYSLWELKRHVPERAWPAWCGNFLIAAMIANWVVKMLF